MYYNRHRSSGPYSSGAGYYSRGLSGSDYGRETVITPRNPSLQRVISTDYGLSDRSRDFGSSYSRISALRPPPLPSTFSVDTSPTVRRREFGSTSTRSDSRTSVPSSPSSPRKHANISDTSAYSSTSYGPSEELPKKNYNDDLFFSSSMSKPISFFNYSMTRTRYSSIGMKIPKRTDYSEYFRPVLQERPILKSGYVPRSREERENACTPIVRERKLIKFRETASQLSRERRRISWDLPNEIHSPLINQLKEMDSDTDTIENLRARSRERSLSRMNVRSSPHDSPRNSVSKLVSSGKNVDKMTAMDIIENHRTRQRSLTRLKSPSNSTRSNYSIEIGIESAKYATCSSDHELEQMLTPNRRESLSSSRKAKKQHKSLADVPILTDQTTPANDPAIEKSTDALKSISCLTSSTGMFDISSEDRSRSETNDDQRVSHVSRRRRRRDHYSNVCGSTDAEKEQENRTRCRSRTNTSHERTDSVETHAVALQTHREPTDEISPSFKKVHRKSIKYKTNIMSKPYSNVSMDRDNMPPNVSKLETRQVFKTNRTSNTSEVKTEYLCDGSLSKSAEKKTDSKFLQETKVKAKFISAKVDVSSDKKMPLKAVVANQSFSSVDKTAVGKHLSAKETLSKVNAIKSEITTESEISRKKVLITGNECSNLQDFNNPQLVKPRSRDNKSSLTGTLCLANEKKINDTNFSQIQVVCSHSEKPSTNDTSRKSDKINIISVVDHNTVTNDASLIDSSITSNIINVAKPSEAGTLNKNIRSQVTASQKLPLKPSSSAKEASPASNEPIKDKLHQAIEERQDKYIQNITITSKLPKHCDKTSETSDVDRKSLANDASLIDSSITSNIISVAKPSEADILNKNIRSQVTASQKLPLKPSSLAKEASPASNEPIKDKLNQAIEERQDKYIQNITITSKLPKHCDETSETSDVGRKSLANDASLIDSSITSNIISVAKPSEADILNKNIRSQVTASQKLPLKPSSLAKEASPASNEPIKDKLHQAIEERQDKYIQNITITSKLPKHCDKTSETSGVGRKSLANDASLIDSSITSNIISVAKPSEADILNKNIRSQVTASQKLPLKPSSLAKEASPASNEPIKDKLHQAIEERQDKYIQNITITSKLPKHCDKTSETSGVGRKSLANDASLIDSSITSNIISVAKPSEADILNKNIRSQVTASQKLPLKPSSLAKEASPASNEPIKDKLHQAIEERQDKYIQNITITSKLPKHCDKTSETSDVGRKSLANDASLIDCSITSNIISVAKPSEADNLNKNIRSQVTASQKLPLKPPSLAKEASPASNEPIKDKIHQAFEERQDKSVQNITITCKLPEPKWRLKEPKMNICNNVSKLHIPEKPSGPLLKNNAPALSKREISTDAKLVASAVPTVRDNSKSTESRAGDNLLINKNSLPMHTSSNLIKPESTEGKTNITLTVENNRNETSLGSSRTLSLHDTVPDIVKSTLGVDNRNLADVVKNAVSSENKTESCATKVVETTQPLRPKLSLSSVFPSSQNEKKGEKTSNTQNAVQSYLKSKETTPDDSKFCISEAVTPVEAISQKKVSKQPLINAIEKKSSQSEQSSDDGYSRKTEFVVKKSEDSINMGNDKIETTFKGKACSGVQRNTELSKINYSLDISLTPTISSTSLVANELAVGQKEVKFSIDKPMLPSKVQMGNCAISEIKNNCSLESKTPNKLIREVERINLENKTDETISHHAKAVSVSAKSETLDPFKCKTTSESETSNASNVPNNQTFPGKVPEKASNLQEIIPKDNEVKISCKNSKHQANESAERSKHNLASKIIKDDSAAIINKDAKGKGQNLSLVEELKQSETMQSRLTQNAPVNHSKLPSSKVPSDKTLCNKEGSLTDAENKVSDSSQLNNSSLLNNTRAIEGDKNLLKSSMLLAKNKLSNEETPIQCNSNSVIAQLKSITEHAEQEPATCESISEQKRSRNEISALKDAGVSLQIEPKKPASGAKITLLTKENSQAPVVRNNTDLKCVSIQNGMVEATKKETISTEKKALKAEGKYESIPEIADKKFCASSKSVDLSKPSEEKLSESHTAVANIHGTMPSESIVSLRREEERERTENSKNRLDSGVKIEPSKPVSRIKPVQYDPTDRNKESPLPNQTKQENVKLPPVCPTPARIGLFVRPKAVMKPVPETILGSSSSCEETTDESDGETPVQAQQTTNGSASGKSPEEGERSRTRSQISTLSSTTTYSSLDDFCGSPVRSPEKFKKLKFRKYTIDDFIFLKLLGKGSFGKVMLAELKDNDMYFAIKCLKKDVVLEDDDVESTMIERRILAMGTQHPYMCKLYCTFHTKSYLFFVMEYLNGGDLMFHIQESGRFEQNRAMFYAAEITSALKFLHKRGIVYRDIKVDNIILDKEGHVHLVDFGMCKTGMVQNKRTSTFCGTPDYIPPEILMGQKYNQSVDWWSFGILLYEMLTGRSPFNGTDEDELFWSICNEEPHYPGFLTKEARQILGLILVKTPCKRLGMPSCLAGEIQDHAFFSTINWEKLEKKQIQPPFKPTVLCASDTSNFDSSFTMDSATLSPIESQMLESMDQEQFKGFSYTNPHITD